MSALSFSSRFLAKKSRYRGLRSFLGARLWMGLSKTPGRGYRVALLQAPNRRASPYIWTFLPIQGRKPAVTSARSVETWQGADAHASVPCRSRLTCRESDPDNGEPAAKAAFLSSNSPQPPLAAVPPMPGSRPAPSWPTRAAPGSPEALPAPARRCSEARSRTPGTGQRSARG